MLQREADLLERLRHPNIVSILFSFSNRDSMREESEWYFAMEYMRGGDLSTLIGKCGEAKTAFLLKQALTGLEHAHGLKIAHRGFKPDNCLLDGNICKLADFGLGKDIAEDPATSNIGTPRYKAPELQWEREDGYDACPADMWSVGVSIHEMVTGEPPRIDKAGNLDMKNLPAKLSPCLTNLLFRLIRLNPEQRLTVSDALQHPWFTIAQGGSPARPLANAPARHSHGSENSKVEKEDKAEAAEEEPQNGSQVQARQSPASSQSARAGLHMLADVCSLVRKY